MKTVTPLATLLLFLPAAAFASERVFLQRQCAFIARQVHAAPEWFLKAGIAELWASAAKWDARLYAQDHLGDVSHTRGGKLTPVEQGTLSQNGRASGRLVTLGMEAGDSIVEGGYEFSRLKDGHGSAVN